MEGPRKFRQWIVGAATRTGINLDVPLGEARIFALYKVEESGSYTLLEHRLLPPPLRHLEFHSPEKLSPYLDGIDILLTVQAGHGAIRSLAQRGTSVFVVSGRIQQALTSLARRGRLLDSSPRLRFGMRGAALPPSGDHILDLVLLRSRLFGQVTRGLA